MTKSKSYKYGPHSFKTYMKPAGEGYEVGFNYQGRNYFVGNFVFKAEAIKWWAFFNNEIRSFSKKYSYTKHTTFSWYCTFLANHMYKCYYSWLDKVFFKHQHTYTKAYTKDYKKYLQFKRKTKTDKETKFHLIAA